MMGFASVLFPINSLCLTALLYGIIFTSKIQEIFEVLDG